MILVLNGIQKLDTDLNVHKSISILRLCIMRTLAMHKAQNHSVVCTIRIHTNTIDRQKCHKCPLNLCIDWKFSLTNWCFQSSPGHEDFEDYLAAVGIAFAAFIIIPCKLLKLNHLWSSNGGEFTTAVSTSSFKKIFEKYICQKYICQKYT